MEKIKSFFKNDNGYKVFTSIPIMLLQVLVAILSFSLKMPMLSVYFFVTYIFVVTMLSKDLSPVFLPLMLLIMTLLANYGSVPTDFMEAVPIAAMCVLAFIAHPFIYRVQWRLGKQFIHILIVALSITLGGAGYLTAKQYFDIVAIYYVFGLGFGLLIAYLLMVNYTFCDERHSPIQVMTKSMLSIGLMGVLMIMPVVIKALIANTDWSVQWSNNLSTMLILSMPFSFYLSAREKRYGIIFFLFGALQYLAVLLTLSRGGILFGSITVFISVIATIVCANKINRRIYVGITLLVVLGGLLILLFNDGVQKYLSDLMQVSPNEARVGMFKVAIDNFLKYPILGTGLAFKGEYYSPQSWAIYWYHSTPFQIIGSLGIFGIVAYGYQIIARARICFARPSKFNLLATMAIIGFELMACVNPGDFTPLPSMIALTAIITVVEVTNRDRVADIDMLFDGIRAGSWYEYNKLVSDKGYKQPPQ